MTVESVLDGALRWHVEVSDCLDALRRMPDASVDALVTDPPAGIGFMGKTWDKPTSYGFSGERVGGPPGVNLARNPTCRACGGRKRAGPATRGCSCASPDWNETALRLRDRDAFVSFLEGVMREVLRVLKPGAHGLVWALPRTSHWTATALENAGFEIRDVITHLFGTGFPKSLDLGEGRGTALKPASEHWILVRRPCEGTTTANVERWGTGGLEIDACRIGEGKDAVPTPRRAAQGPAFGDLSKASGETGGYDLNVGRWPANVILSHAEECAELVCVGGCPVQALDEQSGNRPGMSGGGKHRPDYPGGMFGAIDAPHLARGDSGGASRFFYCAKPSPTERDAGLEDFPVGSPAELVGREDGSAGRASPRAGAGRSSGRRNHHPTVKSTALMRWLCRLVTPPGGVVLDPFTGSGTTGCAAMTEGLRFVGLEQDAEYAEIARARIATVARTGNGGSNGPVPSAPKAPPKRMNNPQQPSLFDLIKEAS